jgi:ABC-type cobalt transport system substrate-binding protein
LLLLTIVAGPLHTFETESETQQSGTDRKSAEVIKPIDSSKNSIAALKALGASIGSCIYRFMA